MKVLVIGGGGMLGHKLVQVFSREFDVFTTLRDRVETYPQFGIFDASKTYENIDIEDIAGVEAIFEKIRPDVVVNAVGLIKQLPNAANVIETLNINAIFPHKLAGVAAKYGSRLIFISTDCVFSGEKGNYTEDDVPDALDLYGMSKNLGEVRSDGCLTIRTSIIGRELLTKHSLVEWFLRRSGETIKGYTDAIFSGFTTLSLAEILATVIRDHADLAGIYHVSSSPISKYDLLGLIKSAYDIDVEIVQSDEVKIDRSLDSSRFRKATGITPAGLSETVERMAADPTSYEKWPKNSNE